MRYRVELRDREMNFVNVLDDRVGDGIKWGFDPTGGCSNFQFRALSKYCTELDLGANFNVRIYLRDEATKDYNLKYQGRIERTQVSISHPEIIQIQGFGYQSQLKDVLINQTYTGMEASAIIKNILDNYVVPVTDISYDVGDVENTGFTIDSIDFNYVSADEAFAKIADIVGGIEYGVDARRKYYFKNNTDEVGFRYASGDKKIQGFDLGSTSREIVNRVVVIGDAGFIFVKDYAQNQNKYKMRAKPLQNASVSTNDVAEQLADAYQAERNGAVDQGTIKLCDDTVFEDSIPVKLIEIITREVLWDEKEWDTFLWAGQPPYRINKISYSIDNTMIFTSELEIGISLPDAVEKIKQLQFNLEQVTQRGT